MITLIIPIKKLNDMAVIPSYSKPDDAGLDLVATSRADNHNYIEYGTSLAVEIPQGYLGYLFPRSSISNFELLLANSVGVIDSGYRQEIKLRFKRKSYNFDFTQTYKIGDRVGQLIIMTYPKIECIEVEELKTSERTGGFGSTGR